MVANGVAKLFTAMRRAVLLPTEAGQLRRRVLLFVPWPVPVLAVIVPAVGGTWSAPGWTILLAGSVAVASLLLAVVVQPTPLPEGLSAGASVRRSLHRFQQITTLRIGLALAPVLVGAGASLAGGGLFPLATALVLSWPQLLLAMPVFFTITRARRAMEAWGTRAYLWAALAQPAPVEWPFVTKAAAWYRARRAQAAHGDEQTGAADAATEPHDPQSATTTQAPSESGSTDRSAEPTHRSQSEMASRSPGVGTPPVRHTSRSTRGNGRAWSRHSRGPSRRVSRS
ncbi:hypothetical protein FHX37_1313 [Haloactinospora alba]|uniref:Uncharacterized protein n=2 Tax=Haloactinospora alba TaxID=405555 RepID=A0A543NHU1_9ACTN|nr:hypothetical protein FHX37_1313 [Haloactinospora alba]